MTDARAVFTRGTDLAARWRDIRDVVDLVHSRAYLLTPSAVSFENIMTSGREIRQSWQESSRKQNQRPDL